MKAITTKYLPATNTKGARIAAFDGDGNRVTVSYDHRGSTQGAHEGAAIALCEKMGWEPYFSSGWLKGVILRSCSERRLIHGMGALGYA